MKNLYISFVGFLMGLADSVPGVSGSTITYILGIYEQFIGAIDSITKRDSNTKDSILFLIKLMFGWIIGFILSILVLTMIVENNIYEVTSFFIGLTLASIPLTFKDELSEFQFQKLIYAFCGLLFVVIIFIIGNLSDFNINTIESANLLIYLYFFIVGLLVATSFILPGISGSTILLIFGLYSFLVGSIKQILTFDFTNLSFVLVFAVGVIVSLIISARILKNFFKNHKTNIIYFIEGLLLGSFIPITHAPVTINENFNKLDFTNISYVFIAIGIFILIVLELLKKFNSRKEV